jgi:hypothetical protein
VQQIGQQHDQLGVGLGTGRTDRLGADLPELAVSALLRRLGAEVGAQVPELHRLRQLVHPVLHVGTGDRRGPFRAQRQRPAAAVVERVHLLADDVGRAADAAGEQLGRLERRRLDPPVTRAAEDPLGVRFEHGAPLRVGGQHVERSPRGLDRAHQTEL